MSPRSAPSAADQALAAAATARGVSLTARQVERWRQNGWLPRRARTFPGRGQGSLSAPDPPKILYQVMAVAALVKARKKSSHIPAVLFGQGFDIEGARLRASFKAVLDDMRSDIGTTAAANARYIEDRSDEASAAGVVIARQRASGVARTWKARLRAYKPNVLWQETLFGMLDLVYAAQQQAGHMLRNLLIGSGIPAAALIPHLQQVLEHASIDRMDRALRKASFDDIVKAREVYDDILVEAVRLRLQAPTDVSIAGVDDTLVGGPLARAVPILFILSIDSTDESSSR